MIRQIILKPLYHRNQESIGLYYHSYSLLNGIVRKLPGVKWSQTNKCWYMPLNPDSYNTICKALNEKATLDIAALKNYLEKRRMAKATLIVPPERIISKPLAPSPAWRLSKENLAVSAKL